VNLHYRKYGKGQALIILHGLFGSSDNWHTLAGKWGVDFQVYALDQRNHGSSPHESVMSYAEMVSDLDQFMCSTKIEAAHIVGHSMGGKVAMLFASIYPEKVIDLVVLDIGVAETMAKHASLLAVLENLDLSNYSHRQEIEKELKKYISEGPIRQFLLKNIMRRVDGSFDWKFNRDALLDYYDELVAGLDIDASYYGPVLFLRGARSDYLPAALDHEILNYFPLSRLKTIADAGHWLHADQPDIIYEQIRDFCRSN